MKPPVISISGEGVENTGEFIIPDLLSGEDLKAPALEKGARVRWMPVFGAACSGLPKSPTQDLLEKWIEYMDDV